MCKYYKITKMLHMYRDVKKTSYTQKITHIHTHKTNTRKQQNPIDLFGEVPVLDSAGGHVFAGSTLETRAGMVHRRKKKTNKTRKSSTRGEKQ